MKSGSIVTQSAPPNLIGNPGVSFNKDAFDEALYNHGYEVIYESAIPCPCKSKENGSPLTTCKNCSGSGFVLFNPNQTRMLLQSINMNTKYKVWSKENLGTVTVSSRDINKLDYMGCLTVIDSDSLFSQVLYPYVYKNTLFAFTVYDIVSIEEVFLFQSADEPLIKLDSSKYTYDGNRFLLDLSYQNIENLTVSVRYHHRLQYHIIDLLHETRRNYTAGAESKGYDVNQVLPFTAIARLSHYVLDAANADKNNLIINDYSK
jgi:hypothetical protein